MSVVLHDGPEWIALLAASVLVVMVFQGSLKVSRWRLACAALVLAAVLGYCSTLRADEGDGYPILNPCVDLTPWDWEYWALGCWGLPG